MGVAAGAGAGPSCRVSPEESVPVELCDDGSFGGTKELTGSTSGKYDETDGIEGYEDACERLN